MRLRRTAVIASDAPRRFAPRQAPLDLGRVYFATEEKSLSIWRFIVYSKRGRLRLDGASLVFASSSGDLLLTHVWSMDIRRQRFPWGNILAALGVLAVMSVVFAFSIGVQVGALALGAVIGLPVGVLTARAAKWVRIEHGDPSLPRQVAWFAPAGYGMYWATKRLRARLEAGMGVVAEGPDVVPYGGRRAGSP